MTPVAGIGVELGTDHHGKGSASMRSKSSTRLPPAFNRLAWSVGMVVGALLAARVTRMLAFGTVIALGPVAGVAAAAVMVLIFWAPSILLAGVSFFLMGAGPVIWVISTATLRQTVTPRDLLGRVSAINIMAYGSRPVGAAIGALVGGLYGAETCLIVAAVGFLAQALVIVTSPVLHLHRQPEMVGRQAPASLPS
jgi:MFS family permease